MRHARSSAEPAAASHRFLEIARLSGRELETLFVRGRCPEKELLAGWEFRGTNTMVWAPLAGIKKFMKGFYRRDGDLYGYNCPVVQNRRSEPWIAKPDHDRPKRFGFYKVDEVDPTARDNFYLHALLLDYSRGGNRRLDPVNGLRDYLVQVEADNEDLYLGKAYYAVGPARIATGFFVLERLRRGIGEIRSA